MTPSPQQQSVIDFVRDGQGHLVVEALAGTGKTTTILEALSVTRPGSRSLFVAFNKSIATTLQARVPAGVDAMTLHSLGLRAVTKHHGRRQVEGRALHQRIRAAGLTDREYASALARVVAQLKNIIPTEQAAAHALATRFALVEDLSDADQANLADDACECYFACMTDTQGAIDFDDMIALPAFHAWRVGTYDYVFVDETQDLNQAQLALVKLAVRDGGRIVAIGDRHQSIYQFRGADSEAIPRMISDLGATVLPLSITYRCPRTVVEQAQKIVPAFEAHPSAPEGEVRFATRDQLEAQAQAGDMVLSRTNAPLVKLCYAWLRDGVRCHIQGRDIGAALVTWFKKRCGTGTASLEAIPIVEEWERKEVAKLEAEDKDTDVVTDKAECLRALLDAADTVQGVITHCEQLFSEASGGIKLSSTHRAKGLEAERVWCLRDTYCRTRINRKTGEKIPPSQGEYNLLYVAQTRAQRELVYVNFGSDK